MFKTWHTSGNDHNPYFDLESITSQLSDPASYSGVYHRAHHDVPMPSRDRLGVIVELLRSVIFPGYFGNSEMKPSSMKYYIGATLDRIYSLLSEQIQRGECFSCSDESQSCSDCEARARVHAGSFLSRVPEIRRMLSLDALAAYSGDPAAKSIGETIFSYPSMMALTSYRIAHELYLLDISLIPRIITEMAHSVTGIDIHPGATIGERFFIDHGTGTVIGETCVSAAMSEFTRE
jgi:serine O-acetyltransferase